MLPPLRFSFPSCTASLACFHPAQRLQCLFRPAQVRLQLKLSEARRHLPVRRIGELGITVDQLFPAMCVISFSSTLRSLSHHAFQIANQDLCRNLRTKEELQQQFIARNLRLRLDGQPGRQAAPCPVAVIE